MNEDFVSFELAKKLKEKGFKEPCFGWYYPSEVCGFDYRTTIVFNNSEYRGSNYKDMLVSHKDEKHINAPTISQVLKWLREEKKIHIEVMFISPTPNRVKYYITNIGGDRSFMDVSDEHYETWEQATLAGIGYCLDNLI